MEMTKSELMRAIKKEDRYMRIDTAAFLLSLLMVVVIVSLLPPIQWMGASIGVLFAIPTSIYLFITAQNKV